jgi:hypothetical protein
MLDRKILNAKLLFHNHRQKEIDVVHGKERTRTTIIAMFFILFFIEKHINDTHKKD